MNYVTRFAVSKKRPLTSEERVRRTIKGLQGVFFLNVLFLLFVCAASPAQADTILDQAIDIDIPPNTGLEDALISWGLAAKVTVMMNTAAVKGHQAHQVKGNLPAREALSIILRDSGLSYTEDGRRIRVAPLGSAIASVDKTDRLDEVTRLYDGQINDGSSQESNEVSNDSRKPASRSSSKDLSEVIVSAEKREERLQDVPVSVTAISAEDLVSSNQVRLQDYYASVPGLNVTPAQQSAQFITIRGINTGGFQNPLVGIVIDDVPFGSSTFLGGGYVVPDIDPSDLARIEVLKGPQGTLYGSAGMGGLVKFVTIDPSTAGFNGRAEAGASGVYSGSEAGFNFRGAVNIPVSDSLAVRVSAFSRQDPGYIDNPDTGVDGVNEAHYFGSRVSALWKPSEVVSLKLSALFQDAKGDGGNFVVTGPGLTGLQENYYGGLEKYDRQIQAYSAILTAKFGEASLTSISGFNVNSYHDAADISSFPGFLPVPGLPGADVAALTNDNWTRKFSQEVRLTTPVGPILDLELGAFYTHEKSEITQYLPVIDSGTSDILGSYGGGVTPLTYTEYAAFGDLTFHITQQFDVQLGARESEIRQSQGPDLSVAGSLSPVSSATATFNENGNAFTYLFTPEYKFSPDLMTYVRLASGYRPGGINVLPLPGQFGYDPTLPRAYNSDKTYSYEIGTKGDFLEHVLAVDASAYYIQWKDIELSELSGPNGYTSNGGAAKSQGFELSLDLRPLPGLTLSAWGDWNDSELTQALPPTSTVQGSAGDPLPYSSRFSGHFAINDEFPITHTLSGVVAGEVSYVGQRPYGIGTNVVFPAYAQTNVHTGIRYETWTVNLYANNLTDRRGYIGQDINPASRYYITPRTVGISVIDTF